MPSIIETYVAEDNQQLDSCPETFKAVAKDGLLDYLRPIMARLPNTDVNEEDDINFSDDYFKSSPQVAIPGTLEYTEHIKNVQYTQSRLPELDEAGKDLWIALHGLRPLTTSYAGNFQCRSSTHSRKASDRSGCPMKQSSSTSLDLVRRVFNWNELGLSEDTNAIYYGVIFRSKRSTGSDTEQLMVADKLSHEEAVTSGGLLMYWYGVPDPTTGSNLATCIWRTRDEARKASSLPLHRKAAKLAAQSYEDFELSRYKVVKRRGETILSIDEWTE